MAPWLVTCVKTNVGITGPWVETEELEYTANLNGLSKTAAMSAISPGTMLQHLDIPYALVRDIYKLRVSKKNPGDTELLNALITHALSTQEAYEAQLK